MDKVRMYFTDNDIIRLCNGCWQMLHHLDSCGGISEDERRCERDHYIDLLMQFDEVLHKREFL